MPSYPKLHNLKVIVLTAFVIGVLSACFRTAPVRFSIAADKSYEASLFRQNCAICHGPEGEGKLLETGTSVPSLRAGEFKFKTEDEIYNQISNGGNGMLPFRLQLTERELRLMAVFVHDKLRGH